MQQTENLLVEDIVESCIWEEILLMISTILSTLGALTTSRFSLDDNFYFW